MSEDKKILTTEIKDLKEKVNLANSKKEDAFSKKKEISAKIIELINKVKELKDVRNSKTNSVRDLKIKREELNKEIKGKVDVLKVLKEKIGPMPKNDIKENPASIRKQIDDLEFKVETEGMSFDKEQKVMKQITVLKKKLTNVNVDHVSFDELRTVSKETNKLKKDANKIHKDIQRLAKESQDHHEEMISLSNKIDDLKKQEKELTDNFFADKKEFNEINSKLKEKLDEIGVVKGEIVKKKQKAKEEKKKKDTKSLEEKTKAVEEKIKKGEKLTTEDILVMQQSSNDDE